MTESRITQETPFEATSGWTMLGAWFMGLVGVGLGLGFLPVPLKIVCAACIPVLVILLPGFFVVEPNMSRVLVLFGRYRGTVRQSGFFWTNPFTMKKSLSLRAHNLDGDQIKVNDLMGNPIEISAVVVWRVADTARATFDVEDYEHFVRVQSDAALRNLASTHPYDKGMSDEVETTLRGSTDEVAGQLEAQLSERLVQAGVDVLEARLNHLAYAPEIASAMLQRQQAKAIVSARQQIVEGAVGMVEMALERLSEREIIELDDERRATLVGNLLIVLCGQANPQPVLNAGSLYN
jgi:regulator of protease activity HflC (stomatin/prohibitin superfamily)